MPLRKHAEFLEALHGRLHRRRYVEPDPLQFVYGWADVRDREVAALAAASLAYGRVGQIVRSVADVLGRLGPRPGERVRRASPGRLRRDLTGFVHRFSTGPDVARMLTAAGRLQREFGSLGACFVEGQSDQDETVLPALRRFAARLGRAAPGDCGHLLADPSRRSACKRWHLMLRWLVRRDEVDPGGWDDVSPARLIVPLDTHMHRLAGQLGATRRRASDERTAVEVTDAFRRVAPEDPTRYDFALTRLGIRSDLPEAAGQWTLGGPAGLS